MKDIHGNEVAAPVMRDAHGNLIGRTAETVKEEVRHAGEGIRNLFGAAFEHHREEANPAAADEPATAEPPAKAADAPEVRMTVELAADAPKE